MPREIILCTHQVNSVLEKQAVLLHVKVELHASNHTFLAGVIFIEAFFDAREDDLHFCGSALPQRG